MSVNESSYFKLSKQDRNAVKRFNRRMANHKKRMLDEDKNKRLQDLFLKGNNNG